ncbi:hypothetical protein FACS1894105_06620 [Clostridia bacterium]|nr:hypothetical protein FACS1894105_06620 [Clostridia bacterium]
MIKKKYMFRFFAMISVFLFIMIVYGGALLNMQFANAEMYRRQIAKTYTQKFVITASRGEIYDRNGIALVTNRPVFNLEIDGAKLPRGKSDYVSMLLRLTGMIAERSGEVSAAAIPVIRTQDGGYSYSMILSQSENERYRLDRYLSKNGLSANTSAGDLVGYIKTKFDLTADGMLGADGISPAYSDSQLSLTTIGVFYEFDRLNVIEGNRYTIAKDVSNLVISAVLEGAHNFPGVEVVQSYERVYHYPKSAPHILGTIGAIWKEEISLPEYEGYAMDAIIGRSGVEKAFEQYLRGIPGVLERTFSEDGAVVDEKVITEAIPGKNIWLTLDIKLQQVAEASLHNTIVRIHELAENFPEPQLTGADANSGATAVISPTTGEILALATYPSYDLSTYRADYESLASDTVGSPLINRATGGLYEPGSVFKIATSIAVLSNGNVTPYERIRDLGKYTKYETYQPVCWLYGRNGGSHGNINITEALRDSCNYFYYVASERIGIDKMNEYSRHLGLGEYTGIEIGETKGILASRAYKEANAEAWYAGDLLQAAIGQSDNRFSPLQFATMLGTVINGGKRYASHLLLAVKDYGSAKSIFVKEPEILDETVISPENLLAVRTGMNDVIETGTAASLFAGFPVKVGGKTGTAQVNINKNSDNATFVAFAPYDNPEISMSVVIEKGSKGTWAGYVSEDILAYYFGYKTFAELTELRVETPEEVADEVTVDTAA